MKNLNLTGPEAGIALSALVAFSDDDPSEEEGAVMRKYYRSEDAESFQKKLEDAGYTYPSDLSSLFPVLIDVLKTTTREFQLRSLAVGYLLAGADGVFDQNEMNLLNKAGSDLGISLYEAKVFAESRLKEIDETTGYEDFRDGKYSGPILDLTLDEAGVALSILVGFSDDDPSDAEAGVMREYFSAETVTSFLEKMKASGLAYPEALLDTKESIQNAFSRASRGDILRILAVGYKVAAADGTVDEMETGLLKEFCEAFVIGFAEVKEYFKAAPV